MRWWPLLVLLLLAAGLTGFGASFTQEETQYRVSSGSMAPTLLGPHYRLECPRCRFPAVLDATQELPREVTCPNCGYQQNAPATATLFGGEEIDWQPIRPVDLCRWDIVLLKDPRNASRLTVKRVAFLPGEVPQIRGGDLYVGERLLRKSPQQREAQKILVFDQRYDAPQDSRFQPIQTTGSGWHVRPGSLGFAPITEPSTEGGDWLEYHHHACLPPPSPADQPATPHDSYAYNHAVSRELFPVSDLWLETTVAHWRAEAFTLRLQGEQEDAVATIQVDSKNGLVRWTDGHRQKTLPLDLTSLQGITIQAGICDRQAFVELHQGNRHWHFPLGKGSVRFGQRPFALKIEGGPAILRDVQIYRDVVYLGPHLRDAAWSRQMPLGQDEIFLLGDNVPISDDSRFGLGAVDASRSLRGRVVRESP